MIILFIALVDIAIVCQPTAYRVASISVIEDRMHERTRSESIRENLTRRVSALSASSLVNLATSIGAANDIRQHQLEKQSKERQVDKESQRKEEKQKENAKIKQKEQEEEKE